MSIVDRIKAELKAQKIPVSKLERDLGFANGYISQLKKGQVPAGRLQAIAIYLNKPIGYFLQDAVVEGKPGNEKSPASEEAELLEELQILRDNPETRALLHATRGLTPGQVRRMTEFLKGMKGQDEDDS